MAKQNETLQLEIVTQEKQLLSQEVLSVTVITADGEITVLPGHIPLLTKLATGELRYKQPNSSELGSYAISGGFMDVNPDGTVTVLADYAMRSDDINELLAEKAKEEAQAAMKEPASRKEFMLSEATHKRALNELKIARRRKKRRTQ